MRFLKGFLIVSFVAGLLWSQRTVINDTVDSFQMPCEEKIYSALMEQQDVIALATYGLTESELKETWSTLVSTHADLFFVADQYEYTLLHDIVLFAKPTYRLSTYALEEARSAYADALEEILEEVDSEWTDLQKALYLHDYLCMYFRYDESLSQFTAPGLLLEGHGVCQAYTLAYADLLDACGIPCSTVLSSDMNHTWNIVTIDGKQYHVDITYDDPVFDRFGRAEHNYFLISDEAISASHNFTAEEGRGQCLDSTYENAIWTDVSTGFIPIRDLFYFIKNGTLYAWDGTSVQSVFTIYSTWFSYQGNGSYWKGNFSSLCPAGRKLLYNTADQILSYDPLTNTREVVYTHKGESNIFGFMYKDDRLILQISADPNLPGETVTVTDLDW